MFQKLLTTNRYSYIIMLRTFVCKCEQEGTYMKTAKTYRIKSRLRFTVFIALMIIITVSSTNTMLGLLLLRNINLLKYVLATLFGSSLKNICRQIWTLAEPLIKYAILMILLRLIYIRVRLYRYLFIIRLISHLIIRCEIL